VRLKDPKTKYILVSPSEHNSEDRHIMDVTWGIYCLEQSGIQPSQIIVIVDHSNHTHVQAILKRATTHSYTIKSSIDLYPEISNSDEFENLVIFFTGHGNEKGIPGRILITPYGLTSTIKNASSRKKCIVFLGQCFAGIFNHVDIRTSTTASQQTEVVITGATNLFESLSSQLSETFLNNLTIPWVANTFLSFIFSWLRNPIDIDGDGSATIMDAFKFAGALSNSRNNNAKRQTLLDTLFIYDNLKIINQEIGRLTTLPRTPATISQLNSLLLQQATLKSQIDNISKLGYIHQEPWILNSFVAQSCIYQ
jgi:hypothetical protein